MAAWPCRSFKLIRQVPASGLLAPFDLADPSWFSQLEERTQLLAVDDRAFTAAFMSTADTPESIDRLKRMMHHLYVHAELDCELGNSGTELEREISYVQQCRQLATQSTSFYCKMLFRTHVVRADQLRKLGRALGRPTQSPCCQSPLFDLISGVSDSIIVFVERATGTVAHLGTCLMARSSH